MMEMKLSKKEIAYTQIKQAIINNEFTSDTLLTEAFLCSKYELSRTPVREALQQLASEGFVNFTQDKGFSIAQIGLEDCLQIYEMREALEGMAARLCSIRISEAEFGQLEDLLAASRDAYEQGDLKLSMVKDMDFHRCVMRASKNTRMEQSLNNLIELSSRLTFKANAEIVELSLKQHEELLQAIKASDKERSEAIMRRHVATSKKYHFAHYYLDDPMDI